MKNHKMIYLVLLSLIVIFGCGSVNINPLQAGPAEGDKLEIPPVLPESGEADSDLVNADEIVGIEIGIEPTSTPDAQIYTDQDYGFAFTFPETWILSEIDHGVVLKKGSTQLSINFRRANEDINPYFGRTGLGAGDLIYSDKVIFFDQVIPANQLQYETLTKAVLYGEPELIEIGELVFMIVLEDLETDYMTVNIPDEVMLEAKNILESFTLI